MLFLNAKAIYRKAKSQETAQIYAFETEYILEIEPENLHRWSNAESKIRAQLQENIGKMFVAEVDRKLAGHVYWNIHNGDPHIFSIYVSKPYRRMGVAKKLMEYVEEEICANGFTKCLLSTRHHNPAKHLFEAIGYQPLGRDNGWIHLEKQLNHE